MFKNYRDKIALSGITVLMIGIILLIFTFLSAYGFLTQSLSIIASNDLVRTFGEALAPLIATCIHIMYLGVMGWIGSLVTIRGVTIMAHAPQMANGVLQQPVTEQKPQPQPQSQPQPQKPKADKPKTEKPKEEKPKEEVKAPEPEFVVMPPEQVSQPPAQPQPPEKEQQQNNQPSQSSSQ